MSSILEPPDLTNSSGLLKQMRSIFNEYKQLVAAGPSLFNFLREKNLCVRFEGLKQTKKLVVFTTTEQAEYAELVYAFHNCFIVNNDANDLEKSLLDE
jgi:hypothetical protein